MLGQLYAVSNVKIWESGTGRKLIVWWLLMGPRITKLHLKTWKITEFPPPLNIPSIQEEPESNRPSSLNGEDEDHEEVLDGDIEHPPNEGLE